jgi:mannose-6-phosphate isomerase-like protein (cupin superfamily)
MPEISTDGKKTKRKNHTLISEREWGEFHQFTHNEVSTVKLLYVNRGEMLSYQSHKYRDELWICVRGSCRVCLDGKWITLTEDNKVFIPRGTKHRIKTTTDLAVIMEVSFGEFDENDIERFEDKYGRV